MSALERVAAGRVVAALCRVDDVGSLAEALVAGRCHRLGVPTLPGASIAAGAP